MTCLEYFNGPLGVSGTDKNPTACSVLLLERKPCSILPLKNISVYLWELLGEIETWAYAAFCYLTEFHVAFCYLTEKLWSILLLFLIHIMTNSQKALFYWRFWQILNIRIHETLIFINGFKHSAVVSWRKPL